VRVVVFVRDAWGGGVRSSTGNGWGIHFLSIVGKCTWQLREIRVGCGVASEVEINALAGLLVVRGFAGACGATVVWGLSARRSSDDWMRSA
jgi:hypothetical protein